MHTHARARSFLFANGVVPLPTSPKLDAYARLFSRSRLNERGIKQTLLTHIIERIISSLDDDSLILIYPEFSKVKRYSSFFACKTFERSPFLSPLLFLSFLSPSLSSNRAINFQAKRNRQFFTPSRLPASIFLTNRSEKIGKLDGTRNPPPPPSSSSSLRLVCLPRGGQVSRASIHGVKFSSPILCVYGGEEREGRKRIERERGKITTLEARYQYCIGIWEFRVSQG